MICKCKFNQNVIQRNFDALYSFSPCNAELILEHIKIYLHFQSFKIPPHGKQEPIFIRHKQHHDSWWPGDAGSQGINSHGIELVLPKYSDFTTIGVKTSGHYLEHNHAFNFYSSSLSLFNIFSLGLKIINPPLEGNKSTTVISRRPTHPKLALAHFKQWWLSAARDAVPKGLTHCGQVTS